MGACRSTFLQQSYAAYSTYQIKQLKERTEKSNNTKKKQTRLHSFKQIFKRVNKRMAGEQQYQKDFHPKKLISSMDSLYDIGSTMSYRL